MARPPKSKTKSVFHGVTLSPELTERVKVARQQFQQQLPHMKVSTADVLRMFIEEGSKTAAPVFSTSLSQPERSHKPAKSQPRKRRTKKSA